MMAASSTHASRWHQFRRDISGPLPSINEEAMELTDLVEISLREPSPNQMITHHTRNSVKRCDNPKVVGVILGIMLSLLALLIYTLVERIKKHQS